jgi:hypothetical protein
MWRTQVAYPERFDTETCTFLDEFYLLGKLSRAGTFTLQDTVGQLVPYTLLPLRIKRVVNMMPLERKQFSNIHAYKGAILNLYIYGYLPNADKALIAREQYWRAFRRTWYIDKPETRKKLSVSQLDKNVAWTKSQEDVRLYKQGMGLDASFCSSSV